MRAYGDDGGGCPGRAVEASRSPGSVPGERATRRSWPRCGWQEDARRRYGVCLYQNINLSQGAIGTSLIFPIGAGTGKSGLCWLSDFRYLEMGAFPSWNCNDQSSSADRWRATLTRCASTLA